jgi:hypothetical protein
MDRRLEKTIKEEEKLIAQMEVLKDKLNNISDKRKSYEKEELYKIFKETKISLEEYKMISKDVVHNYMGGNDIENENK